MSITNDVRTYADVALEQGKHVVDQAQAAVSERITGVAGDATVVVEKVQSRAQNLASKASETYFTGKVEELYGDLKKNEQVAKVLDSAELAATVVLDTVNERVIKPVRSAVAPAPAPTRAHAASTTSTAPAANHKPAAQPAAKPAAKTAAAKAAPAKRPATRRPANKG